MIYQTGTIATTAGQTKIKGTGTRWKDNLAGISEGCPISYLINNVVYMNTVLSVNSDTEINLTYPVPIAATAAKYQIATFVLDSMSDGVRKMLANQQYIQYFLRNMDTWMTQDGIVEVKTPTGESVRLESLVELKKQIDGKLNKTGGTITKNSDALNLRNTSENQALFLGFQKMDGKRRGYIGAPNDKDRLAFVNDIAGTALVLTEDGKLTWQGRDLAALNRVTGEARAAASWFAGQSGAGATFIKLCTIGAGDGASSSQRYQIFVTNTSSSGYSSSGTGSEMEQHFGVVNVTIGNGTKPEKNVLGSYFCTGHFDINSQTVAPILIKQLNAYKAEIWMRAGSYTNYTCLANTQGDIEISQHVTDATLVPVSNGVQSSYYIPNIKVFSMAGDFGIGLSPSEATNTSFLDNVNRTDLRSGRYRIGPPTTGTFPPETGAYGAVLYHDVYGIQSTSGRPFVTQLLLHYADRGASSYRRAFDPVTNSWTEWRQLARYGDFGWGGRGEGVAYNWTTASVTEHFRANASTIWRTEATNDWTFRYCPNLMFKTGDTFANIGVDIYTGIVKTSAGITANTTTYKTNLLWGTSNTTVDSQGNIKKASPVIKVFTDHIELNDESEGVELEKLGTGRYKLKGILGMNSDASWGGIHGGLVVPNGINNLPLVWADFDVLPDGDIIIETRYRKHTLHPRLEAQRLMTYPEFLDENDVEREDYDYCDIPNGHWIDVRVNMPSDSIYNQKLAEAERLAKIEAERVAKEEAEKAAREEAERLEEESKQE
ncbi:TPA: hypothetical protein ACS7Z7_002969 [Providencia alcalifaciens]